jgi:hypothetical protein
LQVAQDLLVEVAELVALLALLKSIAALILLMTWRSSWPDFM